MKNDFLDPQILHYVLLKAVFVVGISPVLRKGLESYCFGTWTDLPDHLWVPNVIHKVGWEQISGEGRPRSSCSLVVVVVERKWLWMVGENINGIVEFIVHAYFGMVVQYPTQQIGSRPLPGQDHELGHRVVGSFLGKVRQESLAPVFGVGTFQIEIEVSNAGHDEFN